MPRVKICPKCGKHNPPSSSVCLSESCAWDLTGVKATNVRQEPEAPATPDREQLASPPREIRIGLDKEPLKPQPGPVSAPDPGKEPEPVPVSPEPAPGPAPVPEAAPGRIYVRICPFCGTENKAVAKVCTACRQDIRMAPKTLSDRKPGGGTAVSSRSAVPANVLIAVLKTPDGTELLKIDTAHPVQVIGREHTLMEYLSGRDYTSRKHAEIVVSGNRLVIRDLGKPNGTFINNVRMAANSMETLKDGDRVSLGGLWEEDWKNSRTGCFAVSYPAGS